MSDSLHSDVVVMYVAMPELNDIAAARRIMETAPHTRVLALSMHKDSVCVREILRSSTPSTPTAAASWRS